MGGGTTWVALIGSGLSVLGSSFLLAVICCCRPRQGQSTRFRPRSTIERIVAHIAAGNLLQALGLAVGGRPQHLFGVTGCYVQALVLQFSGLFCALWTIFLSHSIYRSVCTSASRSALRRLEVIYAVLAYAVPTSTCVVLFWWGRDEIGVSSEAEGPAWASSRWCWINDPATDRAVVILSVDARCGKIAYACLF